MLLKFPDSHKIFFFGRPQSSKIKLSNPFEVFMGMWLPQLVRKMRVRPLKWLLYVGSNNEELSKNPLI